MSKQIHCDSAGTASYHIGSPPDRRMRQIARENGIELTHHARKLTGEDFYDFDYIVAMDEANFGDIRNQSYRSSGFYFPEDKLFLYREFDPEQTNPEVPAQLDVPRPVLRRHFRFRRGVSHRGAVRRSVFWIF